ncbi:hypothetical protein [Pedobacter sp. Leaf41]|uniref:hypothetical protein n=1 Tax=Pedobacter sp. Leaf41 TaxID=1736218 RepID=UPI0012FCC99B|nr:hypothetical protein [Pedobacter sp. Leaf41]
MKNRAERVAALSLKGELSWKLLAVSSSIISYAGMQGGYSDELSVLTTNVFSAIADISIWMGAVRNGVAGQD